MHYKQNTEEIHDLGPQQPFVWPSQLGLQIHTLQETTD